MADHGRLLLPAILLTVAPQAAQGQEVLVDLSGDADRLAAAARIEALNADILASRSATAALENWCRTAMGIADAQVTVEYDTRTRTPITPEQRQRLKISADEPVGYRHVRLVCGGHVLSEAQNWYVPSRLSPVMNNVLATTQTPFGKVIAPLGPQRQTLGMERLLELVPQGWQPGEALPPLEQPRLPCSTTAFRHRALVFDASGQPLAEVHENYRLEAVCPVP